MAARLSPESSSQRIGSVREGGNEEQEEEHQQQLLRPISNSNPPSHSQPIKLQPQAASAYISKRMSRHTRAEANLHPISNTILTSALNSTPIATDLSMLDERSNGLIGRRQTCDRERKIIMRGLVEVLIVFACFTLVALSDLGHLVRLVEAHKSSSERMVRLCIASVDPIKLSSQCVMCNRREFPLTVIDCTGITKVNDLVANPLSVQEATCLIYNCRRQAPDVKPEPYHGSVSQAVNYRGAAAAAAASHYHPSGMGDAGIESAFGGAAIGGPGAGSNIYEMMTPSGMLGGGYAMQPAALQPHQSPLAATSPYMTRFGLGYRTENAYGANGASSALSPFATKEPRGLIGVPSLGGHRQQALPYALVQTPGFPFGSRKYKAALVPLFK